MGYLLVKRFILIIFIISMAFPFFGCEKLKQVLIRKPSEKVFHESYPVKVYTYHSSVIVKATGGELVDYFVKDLSWLESVSGMLEFELDASSAGGDYTRVGETMDFRIKAAGISFPTRATVIKYEHESKLWLMIYAYGNWILWRIKLEPTEEGNSLSMDLLGTTTRALQGIIDGLKISEAGIVKFDMLLAIGQAHFDPDAEPDELTEKGLRGKVYEAYMQGYESSMWVDASPGEVKEWIFADPKNLKRIMPVLTTGDECYEDSRMFSSTEEVSYCPALYRVGEREVEAQVISSGIWEESRRSRSYHHNLLITAMDILVRAEIMVDEKHRGSEVKVIISSELPGPDNPEAMDIMIGVADIPGIMEMVLPEVKSIIEK